MTGKGVDEALTLKEAGDETLISLEREAVPREGSIDGQAVVLSHDEAVALSNHGRAGGIFARLWDDQTWAPWVERHQAMT
jgi:hypothetical protein